MTDSIAGIHITDYGLVERTKRHVTLGHYFVFVGHPEALKGPGNQGGRRHRLLLGDTIAGPTVFPLVDQPVELAGIEIRPPERRLAPIGCLVADRDLYRAEQDTVHLFVAFPKPPENLRLRVEYNGQLLAERKLELEDGVGIETLSMLLPGAYTARLVVGDRDTGATVAFSVAEYTLPPLSGRLLSHQFDRACAELVFELFVESYQMPYEEKLQVALVDHQGRELHRINLQSTSPGHYRGRLPARGAGPFRLRLSATDDGERIAEVAVPGSRAREREVTVISELGQEMLFSLAPEPGTRPIRGGYLGAGDCHATALSVTEVVSERRILHANTAVESLVLVILDLTTGRLEVQDVGAVAAGQEVAVSTDNPLCTVFAGCFVDGRPFEGYTTFMAPPKLVLGIDAPETTQPRRNLTLRLHCRGNERPLSVLLCVRDNRLTATDVPAVSLGAALKQSIALATEGMTEAGFQSLEERLSQLAVPFFDVALTGAAGEADEFLVSGSAVDAVTVEALDDTGMCDFSVETSGWLNPILAAPQPARSLFAEALFYGIVPTCGEQEVNLPLGDALGTLTVEAFALSRGDWTQARTNVVVDQPVRVDLELPPTVHPEDQVSGQLRAVTASGNARIALSADGKPLPLYRPDTKEQVLEAFLATPVTLEFHVSPGMYLARVEDSSTGESDSLEMRVETPGRCRSYTRGVSFLQAGEALDRTGVDAVSLRVLPTLEAPLKALVTTTAGYAHLCCEQTAAKILAATFMYLTGAEANARSQAEAIILAGTARERKMLRPGKGFSMYPETRRVSAFYSRLAVRYLWTLHRFERVSGMSASLRKAVQEGLAMADTAALAHGMERLPKRLQHMEDAYAAATAGGDPAQVKAFIEARVDFTGSEARPIQGQHAVADRALLAYAAASLIALGDWRRGIQLANQVTRQFNQQGALYSTVDSVAAIVLMIQLQASELVSGQGRVRVNGQEMTGLEAAELSESAEAIHVLDGVVPVEVIRIREEDWCGFASAFPLEVDFRDSKDKPKQAFDTGDRADLRVRLTQGYQSGDLLHVSLPAAMSWLQGGAKIKAFTLDFEGRDELRVPLVVTSKIDGMQHFALCVRNMFKEERSSSPGMLVIAGAVRP